MERALLVTIKLKREKDNWSLDDIASEMEELIAACGVEAVDNITYVCDKPTANLFIGEGKTKELAVLAGELDVDVLIFSQDLSGTQQRNLEDIIGRKTIDRTQLILDIFARHAKSLEGKTQVELAQLQYLMPRLIGKGLILSRMGGGIGTSGPGEQALEIDRRRIRAKIDRLRQDLKQLSQHRLTMRKKRKENALPTVALVGYTNAGKSTLLNSLTSANQVVCNSLFTTLDTLYKSLRFPNGENAVISDTVGFLRNLPHHLIEAFKATLEEVNEADLLIHVLDVSNPRVHDYNLAVMKVLQELGAQEKPMITALNKIDLLDDDSRLERLKKDFVNPVAISAKFGTGQELLLEKIQENFLSRMERLEIILPHKRMDLVDLFYRKGRVEDIQYQGDGIHVKLTLPKILASNLLREKDIKVL
ncbi:MAG: GTPase HflX [Candidatus Omnitrophica bacterium]|nr:GTPase HflX [Candidatus Omnitrophota bacterium]